jgi:serine/threonine-protein kinase
MAQQKYSIVEKLDAGGMAEVWKGKATSLRGFEKLVAIKRVLPNLAKNKKFIAMFLDEARLSLFLNHANVVQTFDIGVSGETYFIVMEFVDGSNLKSILDTAHERGFRIPQEQVAFIGIEVCKGLSHAHNRKDQRGRPLGIVHRDISPPNILISREGEVKLVDFGLAKAASQLTLTDPGVVKGKFSYLSPEAAHGEKVNLLTDVFATGIVLWEALAGRRLFDGRTDLDTVDLVRKAEIPALRDFNPDVHPVLESVIRRALARDPKQRPENAAALAHDLAKFLFDHRMMVTSYDIGVLVKRIQQERTKRVETVTERPVTSQAQAIERMIQDEIMQFTSIEDLEKMTFKAVAESNPLDQHPAFGGEDPRDWASEMGMEDEGGDHTRMDLSPFEKDGLGYREGRSLDQILEGPGESTETLAQQTIEMPAPAPIQARRTAPPPPPPGAVDALQAPGVTAERRVVPPVVPPVSKPPSGAVQRTTLNDAAALKRKPGPHPGHAPNLPANATRDEIRAQATASARMAQGGTSSSDGGMVRGIVAGAIVAAVAGAAAFYFL